MCAVFEEHRLGARQPVLKLGEDRSPLIEALSSREPGSMMRPAPLLEMQPMTRAAEWAVLVRHDGEFGYVCVAGFRCAERIPVLWMWPDP